MTESGADVHIDEGPEKEIEAWTTLLKVDMVHPPVIPETLERFISMQLPYDAPEGFTEQPLYADPILRRIMRMALMHGTLSQSPETLSEHTFEIVPAYDAFVSQKFPGHTDAHIYEGYTTAGRVLFAGTKEVNESVTCLGIYLKKPDDSLRPVLDMGELFTTLGIRQTPESLAIITKEILSQYTLQSDIREHMSGRLERWYVSHSISRRESVSALLRDIAERGSDENDIHATNALLEGLTTERHLGQHAYINDLAFQYRATTLLPFALPILRLPEDQVTYMSVDESPRLLRNGTVDIAVHPTTIEALSGVMPQLHLPVTDSYQFHPTVGARSGSVQIEGIWQDYQVKMDLIKFMSGWLRMCGTNTLKEETEAASFLYDRIANGYPLPSELHIMPTTEGALYNIGSGLNLATLARKMPEELKSEILIPAAFLYSPDVKTGKTFVSDILSQIPRSGQDEFISTRLIQPIMSAWNYFLSLEDPEKGHTGLAFEMHGANFYYVWDRSNQTIRGDILTKDFASNRILSALTPRRSLDWLLGEYDHGLSYLFLAPLVSELSRSTGKPTGYFDAIIRESFIQSLTARNKQKFLLNGSVVSVHQDVFDQLQHFRSPRQKLWTKTPRFRPSNSNAYDM